MNNIPRVTAETIYRKPCTRHSRASPPPNPLIGSIHEMYSMTKRVCLPSLTVWEKEEHLRSSYVSHRHPSDSQTAVLMDQSQAPGSKPHSIFQSPGDYPCSPRVCRACYQIVVRFRVHRFRNYDNFLFLHILNAGSGWRRHDEQSFQRPCAHPDVIRRASDETVFERIHGLGR